MNKFAAALAAGNYVQVWACSSCTVAQVNGDSSGMDEEQEAACNAGWERLARADGDITPGVVEHRDDCPGEGTEGCECECKEESWGTCEVCREEGGEHFHSFLIVYGQR